MKRVLSATLAVALSGCGPTSDTGTPGISAEEIATIREELIERAERDQHYRSFDYGSAADSTSRRMMSEAAETDSLNLIFLKSTVDRVGWPDAGRFGTKAAHAAFLLAQHADSDPSFQERILPLLEAAVARGEGSARDLAFLVDRVKVKQERPQVYGTQYDVFRDSTGSVVLVDGKVQYAVPVVVDRETLDERRATVGLGPWLDYEKRMAASQGRSHVASPQADTTGR